MAGLIIGIVATLISFSQYFVAGKFARNFESDKWPERIENIVNDVQENVIKDLEDANVSIKVEDGDEKVEINVGTDKSDKEKTLEELEGADTTVSITVTK
jgi:hypothetical protein